MPLSLRELHTSCQPLVCPLAHDALSARLIERAGFRAMNVGGSALIAARYALPDVGIAGLGEMVSGVRDILAATDLPFLVDADDGYGDEKNVTRTVQLYEKMGVAGLVFEDASWTVESPPARLGQRIAPLDIIERKLRAAISARANGDMVIIGRTNAAATEGLDEALRRARRFREIGVDGVFVAGLKTREQYARVGDAFRNEWNIAAIPEGSTPWLSPAELHAMGFSQIFYPNILIGRAARAIEQGLERLKRFVDGDSEAFSGGERELGTKALSEALCSDAWRDAATRFA